MIIMSGFLIFNVVFFPRFNYLADTKDTEHLTKFYFMACTCSSNFYSYIFYS